MTDEFRGKVAVVTGGGAGIGLAAAGRLAREGASVVICSDHEDQARQAAGNLREEGLEVRGRRGDVTSSADMRGLVDFAVETYGGVDVLVNSAGVQRYGTLTVAAHPPAGSPLASALGRGPAAVGLLGIEPETRRRMRVNGTGTLAADG